MREIIISASLLNADFSNLSKDIDQATQAGIDWIHLDIMDGHFVPNISYGPEIALACRRVSKLPIDTHLMIDNPDLFIEKFADAGSDKISVHVENNPHLHRTISLIKSLGKSPGVVVNPGTPIENIFPVLHLVDLVLIMTVNPGFGGQSFLPETLEKIKTLYKEINTSGLEINIQVDGGIDNKTLPIVRDAGANIFVVGSYIFKNSEGINQAVQKLRSA